jgi:hypothetical protein
MGRVIIPGKALLFIGLIYNSAQNPDHVYKVLEEEFGTVCLSSARFPFTETNYYNREMGEGLLREFIAFEALVSMERISDIKLRTNWMEHTYFSSDGRRTVNIDPGYITSAKVVLATTKDFQHRLYLGNGIYAEVTLRYRKSSFYPWEWTYRDYRRRETIDFFNRLREVYRAKLKGIS